MAESNLGNVARYALLEKLGEGSMGEVYRARDTQVGRTVAIRLLPAGLVADEGRRDWMMEEARAATALSHPAVATLFEVGESEGRVFLAYEYVAGETLRAAMAGGPIPAKRAVAIAVQIADALADAHASGIVHRDIRPENVILSPKGAAKVLGFGAPRWISATEAPVAYMSPEQALEQPLDPRTDIFSLGVVLYEMLTGRNPFAAANPSDTVINILRVQPEPPSAVNKEAPAAIDAVVLRMLARDVNERAATAAGVSSVLRALFGERTEHVIEPEVEEVRPEPRRRRAGVWATLAVLIVVVAAAGIAYPKRDALRGWWRYQFGPTPAPIVTVLPFTEDGGQPTPFGAAIAADLADRLGQTPGVRLPGRSVPRLAANQPAAEIARRADAAVAIAGNVRRDAGELRIALEMIEASDGLRIWRREFINPESSLMAAQALMVDEVARALELPRDAAHAKLRERSLARYVAPDAYDAYSRAREAMTARRYGDASKLFDRAVKLDSGLAEAHAGLAAATYMRVREQPELLTPALQTWLHDAGARALAIEPDLAGIQAAVGLGERDFRQSLVHFARAAALDPSLPDTFTYLADRIFQVDGARAKALYDRAERLEYGSLRPKTDPRRTPAGELAAVRELLAAGRADEGRDRLRYVLGWWPDFCEAKAVQAGLQLDAARAARPRATVPPPAAPPAAGQRAICGAVMAAAIGDAASAGAAVRQIAADPALLRAWMQPVAGLNAQTAIDRQWYPWGNVLGTPEMTAAVERLRKAYGELKTIADQELRALPQ